MAGARQENRRSLLQRLKKVVAAGVTIERISRECGIPVNELETFVQGNGYLYQREIERLRACMPSFEPRIVRRPSSDQASDSPS